MIIISVNFRIFVLYVNPFFILLKNMMIIMFLLLNIMNKSLSYHNVRRAVSTVIIRDLFAQSWPAFERDVHACVS